MKTEEAMDILSKPLTPELAKMFVAMKTLGVARTLISGELKSGVPFLFLLTIDRQTIMGVRETIQEIEDEQEMEAGPDMNEEGDK